MLLIPLAFLVSRHVSSAPISKSAAQDEHTVLAANLTALNTDIAPGWVPSPTTRGTWDILYSCLFTIGLCVWTAVHVNVPPPKASQIRQVLRKLKVVLLGILAPEAVLYIAFCELREAYALKCELNDEWSRTHGESQGDNKHRDVKSRAENSHKWWRTPWQRKPGAVRQTKFNLIYGFYCVMGGFVVDITAFHNNREQATLTAKGIMSLARRGKYLEINEQSISDKSKADFLAKGLVCLQVSWVFLQCIARKAAGFPITILELHTLVHIFCVIVMYGFWLRKPLNVSDPTKINLWLTEEDVCYLLRSWDRMDDSNCSLKRTYRGWPVFSSDLVEPLSPISETAGPSALVERVSEMAEASITFTFEIVSPRWPRNVPELNKTSYKLGPGVPLPGYPLTSICSSPELDKSRVFLTLSEKDVRRLAKTAPDDDSNTDNIASYIGNLDHLRDFLLLALEESIRPIQTWKHVKWILPFTLIALCTAYSAVHMAAWNFKFPSAMEKLLCKISCLVLVTEPTAITLLFFSAKLWVDARWENLTAKILFIAWVVFFISFSICRLCLIVESLTSLRQVPVGVYEVVTWVNYIPHL